MVALPATGSREIIMRSFTLMAAVAVLAASVASYVAPPWHMASSGDPAGLSPYELTLAAPAMLAGPAPDAF
jgi:hypothetical protein